MKPYDGFIAAFKSGDAEVLRQQAAVCMPIFGQDGNAGLALQCMDAFRRFQIAALTHTYVTLSVGEIARRNLEVLGRGGGEEETEGYILGMVERDEIRASLSHEKPGPPDTESIVHFHNKPHSELRTLRALEKQILRTVAITNEAKAFEKKLGLSKEYIQHLNKLAKSGERHDTRSYIENDPMDTGADMFESFFPARSSTGFSYDDGGDDDMMHQDSFDDEP